MAHRGGRLAALGMSIVLVVASCDTAKVTPAPSGPGSSQAAGGSAQPGQTAGRTNGPQPTGGRPVGSGKPAPLPLPAITDPGEMGLALYNPGQVGEAVTSLLALLGIGIYDADGNVITAGNERVEGDPWLTENEVRGLIDMGVEDLLDAGDEGPKYGLRDLYDSLSASLPDTSFGDFVAAYRDSYADHPDDLVPLAMIGQPMDENARLTRTQLWLLFLDGFVDLARPVTARPAPGTLTAVGMPHFPTANPVLPMLLQPNGMSAADWVEIRSHLPTIAYTIDFKVSVADAHEGHGSTGRDVALGASVGRGRPFRSAIAPHRILLQPNPASMAGLDIQWGTTSQARIDAHGTLDLSIPSHASTDATGQTYLLFTPKKEVADGHGFIANEIANVNATAQLSDLLRTAYLIDNNTFARILAMGTLGGTRTVHGGIDVEWHTPGLNVWIMNEYEVKLDVGSVMGPVIATAYRKGSDDLQGVLFRLDDGTYVGTFAATSTTERSSYQYNGTLAGKGECQDEEPIQSDQDLYVVGTPSGRTLDTTDSIQENSDGTIGQPADKGLRLRFFPITPPDGAFGCQRTWFYDWYQNRSIAPAGVSLVGEYIPINDSRFNNPTIGYEIILPIEGEISYLDQAQTNIVTHVPDVNSLFTINVDKNPPE